MHAPNLPDLRRSSRLPLALPILVTSLQPESDFSEVCETLVAVKVPKPRISGCLVEEAHNDIIRVADAFGRDVVSSYERSETETHAGAAFERLGLCPNRANQLR